MNSSHSNLLSFPRTLLLTIALAALATLALIAAGNAGWKVHGLTGHSMEPTIAPGSVLISKAIPTETLAVGDIVLFEVGWLGPEENVTAAHRIIRIERGDAGTLIYTRGDGNTVDDPAPTMLHGNAVRASMAIGYGEQMLQLARFIGAIALAAFLYVTAMRTATALHALTRRETSNAPVMK